MIHIGIGETALNNLFSILSIPPLAGGTVKAREREIGPAIEALARKSCQEVFKSECQHKERIATDLDKIQNLAELDCTTPLVQLKFGFDFVALWYFFFAWMIHIGIGETALNNLLSILSIPPLVGGGGGGTVKAREREIGPAIEALARKSCQEVFKSECQHKERMAAGQDSEFSSARLHHPACSGKVWVWLWLCSFLKKYFLQEWST